MVTSDSGGAVKRERERKCREALYLGWSSIM